MSPLAGFVLFLLLTVGLLLAVVLTGRAARRRAHVTLVLSTLASLATTIVFAERLGELYDLRAAGAITPIHLALAKATTVAYLLPLVTGVWTTRRPRMLVWHRRCAYLVVALTLACAVTGTWMLLASDPLPAGETGLGPRSSASLGS